MKTIFRLTILFTMIIVNSYAEDNILGTYQNENDKDGKCLIEITEDRELNNDTFLLVKIGRKGEHNFKHKFNISRTDFENNLNPNYPMRTVKQGEKKSPWSIFVTQKTKNKLSVVGNKDKDVTLEIYKYNDNSANGYTSPLIKFLRIFKSDAFADVPRIGSLLNCTINLIEDKIIVTEEERNEE